MSPAATDSLRLGLMTPLSGVVSMYGIEIERAARVACAAINAQGGVLGRRLELVVADDGSLPDTAVPAALRLLDEHGCVALIGNLLSNSRIAVAARVAEARQVPLLNFSFYEGSIGGRWFFNFSALPNQQIERMIPWMARHYGLKMFFAGNNYEWPRGSIDAAKRSLLAAGGQCVGEEYLPLGCTATALDDMLERLSRSGADVFVPYFAGADQLNLLPRFAALGLKPRMAVVMGGYDEMLASLLPPAVREGLYSSNTYYMSLATPENRDFLAALAQQDGVTGLWPAGNGIVTNFGEGAWVCVQAFAAAAAAAGSCEPAALARALASVSLMAPQGRVTMDAATHHAAVNSYLARCAADGAFTIVEHFGVNPPRLPDRYRQPLVPAAPSELIGGSTPGAGSAVIAQRILAVADTGMIAVDRNGRILELNQRACTMFGYERAELLGTSLNLLLPPHVRIAHSRHLAGFAAGSDAERPMRSRGELSGYRKDGSFFPIKASLAKYREADDWVLVATLLDISEDKQAEEMQAHRATHDAVTGLPRRALISERIGHALAGARRQGMEVALLFVDLDGFKLVNDSHGHEAGDMLLRQVAARLLAQVRPGDTVARLSGDEFVILCEQIDQPATIAALAQRINDDLRRPIPVGDCEMFVTASIGIAIGSAATHSAAELLRDADTAMYAVKRQGRDGWRFFSAELHAEAQQRLAVISGLRQALERDEFSVLFQPIVASDSTRIAGAELLLRWRPPGGEVSPAVFIPIAETTGSIVAIGAWVFRQACLAAARWAAEFGDAAPYVSVNVSTRQLDDPALADVFAGVLAETGADPSRMVIEITETALMADADANLRMLRRLAELGLRAAVDDFGTGYSSLAQLLRMPVTLLKIDREFIDGLDKRRDARIITSTVIGMGRSLGMRLIAEGVENAAQFAELSAAGCDYVQGYYFHRPMREEQFVETYRSEISSFLVAADDPLHFIVYISECVRLPTQTDLAELLDTCRRNNARNGITGCLLFHDGMFMQMLEGRESVIKAQMEKIKRDTRHRNVCVTASGLLERRVFHAWSMGFRDMSQLPGSPDFDVWRENVLRFIDFAASPQASYAFIAAFAAPAGDTCARDPRPRSSANGPTGT